MKKTFGMMLFFILGIAVNTAFAVPKEVIIIRHGDKLLQPEPGPTLSPKGIVRSLAFAHYFINQFGEPDFIVATAPINEQGKDSSIRELQTIAPLANLVAAHHAKTDFPILHPYKSSEFSRLANYLLKDKKFAGKKILICWNHTVIPQLAETLGVSESLQVWPSDDFDTVYVLQYDSKGAVTQFKMLHNQYPVTFNGSWQELYNKVK